LSSFGNVVKRIIDGTTKNEKLEVPPETPQVPAGFPPKVYLKALPLRSLEDVDAIKREVKLGNILILKVSPLARKSVDDIKRAVGDLFEFARLIGGDIARLGEERVVITPSFVQIWRGRNVKAR